MAIGSPIQVLAYGSLQTQCGLKQYFENQEQKCYSIPACPCTPPLPTQIQPTAQTWPSGSGTSGRHRTELVLPAAGLSRLFTMLCVMNPQKESLWDRTWYFYFSLSHSSVFPKTSQLCNPEPRSPAPHTGHPSPAGRQVAPAQKGVFGPSWLKLPSLAWASSVFFIMLITI